MKKITLFAAICCFGLAFNAKAQSPYGVGDTMKVNGMLYLVTDATNKYVEVTNDSKGYSWASANAYTGAVSIPSSVANNGNGQSYTVTSIGNWAFIECSGLTSVTIPNSVTSIGGFAFVDCTGLTSVTIPNSVTLIGNSVFYNCSGLTSVAIGNSVTSIGGSAFSGTPWYNNKPDGLVYINNVLYKYKGTMPANTAINIQEGTVSISPEAFEYCSGLTSVTIPNSVTEIGREAFCFCSGLTSVTIPNSVDSIGRQAFSYCSGLTSVTSNAVTPPTIFSSTFDDIGADAVFYVPCVSEAAYMAALYWSGFNYGECFTENGLNDVDVAEATIYPNPVKDVLNIDCSDRVESVEVFNLFGQKVYAGTKTTIDVSSFAKGNYVVKLHTDKSITTKKFVVE
ncbi:MAG: leucine-rich repeat protein [Bacteroidales bacterium]|jgi:hypothetical protein|nr:leucine-rich repeat protein [Bacteroidales bacterium]